MGVEQEEEVRMGVVLVVLGLRLVVMVVLLGLAPLGLVRLDLVHMVVGPVPLGLAPLGLALVPPGPVPPGLVHMVVDLVHLDLAQAPVLPGMALVQVPMEAGLAPALVLG